MSARKAERVEWVCTGNPVELADGRLGVCFRDDRGEEVAYVRSKSIRSARFVIGGRYEVSVERSGDRRSLLTGGGEQPVLLGIVDDAAEVLGWRTASRAVEAARAARAGAKRLGDARIAEALGPLRREYRKKNAAGRLAIELALLSFLRTGGAES